MNKLILFSILSFSIILSGCAKKNINISLYKNKIFKKEYIPQICKLEFNQKLPKVAVVSFTNNTSYGKAQTNNKNSSFKFNLGISPIYIGIEGKYKKNKTKRFIDPKLSSSIVPLMENLVLNTGGAELFSRVDMDKIDSELKLQDSGLLDPSSIVEFGKASGVQYIITGSLNYVKTNITNYSSNSHMINNLANNSQYKEFQILGLAIKLLSNFTDGTEIKTSLTVKIIDVSTGAIKFTYSIIGESDLGNNISPTYSEIIEGIKDSVSQTVPFLSKEFSQYFSTKAYIKQLRTNEENTIVQVSYGRNQQIKKGDIFEVYSLEENIDPLNNKKTCDKIREDIILEASNEIDYKSAWLKVKEGNQNQLKLLQIIQKKY